jgi:hypothetical protein
LIADAVAIAVAVVAVRRARIADVAEHVVVLVGLARVRSRAAIVERVRDAVSVIVERRRIRIDIGPVRVAAVGQPIVARANVRPADERAALPRGARRPIGVARRALRWERVVAARRADADERTDTHEDA